MGQFNFNLSPQKKIKKEEAIFSKKISGNNRSGESFDSWLPTTQLCNTIDLLGSSKDFGRKVITIFIPYAAVKKQIIK